MNPIVLLPASQVSLAERAALMTAAYADYQAPLQMTRERVRLMDAFFHVDLARSLVARSQGELVGMALLSRRGTRGWVSAVGVLPAQRRQGLARQLVAGLIDNAHSAGLRELTLEVIDANRTAQALYRELGFSATRELLCWRFPAEADRLPIPEERLTRVSAQDLWQYFPAWHDQPPCWQREEASLRQMAGRARAFMLAMDGVAAGYCLVNDREAAVSILDVGINPQLGPVIAGRVLLQALSALYPGRALNMINVPADAGLNRALAALHFLVVVRQQEMRRAVSG